MYADMSGYHDRMSMPTMGYGAHSPTASSDFRMSMPAMPVGMFPTSPTAAPPYVPLLIKDDDQFKKYFKLRSMGMPDEQIKLKMSAEKIDPTILDRPDGVSPNDPGVRASLAVHPTLLSMYHILTVNFALAATTGVVRRPTVRADFYGAAVQYLDATSASHFAGYVSLVFSCSPALQLLTRSSVSSGKASIGGGAGSGGGAGHGGLDAGMPPPKVEDQMAKELAAAESALDDIFGDEQQQTKGVGGMSMIEQLEKKARKDNNKKLVDNRGQIVELIRLVLDEKFTSDEHAIQFYGDVAPKLERFGLSLGTDAVQTWSAR
jgi:hypothetical protein